MNKSNRGTSKPIKTTYRPFRESILRFIASLILTLAIVTSWGCTGSQEASVETPQTVQGSSNTLVTKTGQQQLAGQGAVNGEIEEVTNNISNGVPTWALVTLILGIGIIIPQPKFIRIWF